MIKGRSNRGLAMN